MPDSGVAGINQIEAGIEKAWEFVAEEVENDFARGCGLPVVVANRRGWIDNDDGETGSRLFESDLLGEPLRAFVVAHHVLQRDRRIFVAGAVLRHADTADSAGIDN